MKQFYKKLNLLVLIQFASLLSFAQTFNVDGIYYSTKEYYSIGEPIGVEVIAKTPKYNGNIVIPSTVNYTNKSYPVTGISDASFYYCIDLTNISLPNTILKIGGYSFSGCSKLQSITIPSSVNQIGTGVFLNCSALQSIKVENPLPLNLSIGTFNNIYTTATLYVPAGSKSAYQTASEWKNFTNIVEYSVTGTEALNSLEANINIFPNPATENVTISFNESISGFVSIIDSKGNVVLTKAIAGNTSNISTT